jgi:hypothetical protein
VTVRSFREPFGSGHRSTALRFVGLGVSALVALAGCASAPVAPPVTNPLLATPIVADTPPGGPPIVDGRARFRAVFCDELAANPQAAAGRTCDRWLWHMPDEPALPAVTTAPSGPAESAASVIVVPGAFSECYGDDTQPFADGDERLTSRGFDIHRIVVSGRSGTDNNARQIAAALAKLDLPAGRRVMMVGFSKGANDILRFLVDFPDQASRIDAVISVASPILGTPAAGLAAGTYNALLKDLPLEACPPGDGQVLESLRPETRRTWVAANPLPSRIRYYSIAAFADRDRIASLLVPPWRYLNGFDRRNDGQVIASKTVIPGATVLGYVNSDHLGLAMHNVQTHAPLVDRDDAVPFPTEALLLALVLFVQQDLNGSVEAR